MTTKLILSICLTSISALATTGLSLVDPSLQNLEVFKKTKFVSYSESPSDFEIQHVMITNVPTGRVQVREGRMSSDEYSGAIYKDIDSVQVVQVVGSYQQFAAGDGREEGEIRVNFRLSEFTKTELENIESTKAKVFGHYGTRANRNLAQAMFALDPSPVDPEKEVLDTQHSISCGYPDTDSSYADRSPCVEKLVYKKIIAPDYLVRVLKR